MKNSLCFGGLVCNMFYEHDLMTVGTFLLNVSRRGERVLRAGFGKS